MSLALHSKFLTAHEAVTEFGSTEIALTAGREIPIGKEQCFPLAAIDITTRLGSQRMVLAFAGGLKPFRYRR